MQIHHIQLSKQQLDSIPENERYLLILIGHAANELGVLTKLFRFSTGSETQSYIDACAKHAQALLIGKIFTGKLHEFSELLRTAYYGTQISREYEPLLTDEGRESLRYLQRYFSRPNIIRNVRNDHAFHYSLEQVRNGYDSVHKNDTFDIYLSETNANSLYGYADTIVNRSMLNQINNEDHMAGFDQLISETTEIIRHINRVCAECLGIVLERYVGSTLDELESEIIELENVENCDNFTIPYFVYMD